MKTPLIFPLLLSFFIVLLIGLLAACASPAADTPLPSTHTPTVSVSATPTGIWTSLLLRTPVPFTTPLPASDWTPIDGSYAKYDPSEPQWWACRRCADYRPAGGIWKLQFDRGVMRIYYNVTGWHSLASYTVSDDRLYLFNDPYCPNEVGEYTWHLEDKWNLDDRSLVLEAIRDSCSINLRGENLSAMPWASCQPPNTMTGASDHWHKTPGCETVLTPPETPVPATLEVALNLHPGDARKFAQKPDVLIDANDERESPPAGFTLAYSPDSISYGLNRVLWGAGSSVELTTQLPSSAMGVQILGDATMGWARLLFDGQEVWRGDTLALGSRSGRFGGYLEVTGYPPGNHTLRVEALGFDYRPVTVAFFGFSR